MTTAAIRRMDQDIQRDLLEELKWEAQVRPNEIGATVRDGVVTLAGWVDNYAKKWAAERAAHRIRGVRAVANDIEVRLPTSAKRTDADIAIAATRALEWDAFVPLEDLDVTVSDGWVTLQGEVEWEYQRRAAERAVGRLAGVLGVSNGITVRPPEQPVAGDLKELIETALVRSAETDADRIDIEVRGDRIVLRGNVRSWIERQEAERVTWSAPGVLEVENQITVET
ncbi:MAG TPA: BON domain-containing protein [Micromonosporaceae bacterium]|nr:BON domain-containing protein [Micromonosporaceae bacterium]